VAVDVIVTDKRGRHVPDLTAYDFTVYESDVRQKIVTFVAPVGMGAQAPTKPARKGPPATDRAPALLPGAPTGRSESSASEAAQSATGQLITILMDLGDLRGASLKRACDAAVRYLEGNVAPQDFVAVYWVDDSLHLASPFSRDRQPAIDGLKRLSKHVVRGKFTPDARAGIEEEIRDIVTELIGIQAAATFPDLSGVCSAGSLNHKCLNYATLRNFLWTQSTLQARAVFTALRAIGQAYRDLPGRKNVVVFSEGFLRSPDAKAQMAAVIDAANRANVAFYVIDAGGLSAGFGAASHGVEPTVNQEMYTMAMWGPSNITSYGLDKFDWAEHLGTNIVYDDLGQVAAATGGLLMKNQNDLLAGLAAVDRDLREFYTLVYQPTNKTYDGSFRKIKVEVLKPGLRVRHRLGYWAIPPGQEMLMTPAAAQLLAGVQSGSLQPAFAPQVNAALLLAPSGELAAPVRVSLPTDSVKFEKDPNKDIYRSGVTVVLVAYDTERRIVGVHQRFLNLQFDKKRWQEFRKTDSLDIVARLAIPKLESLSIEAILQFTNGTVAKGARDVPIAAGDESPLRLTSVLLSNHIEAASGPADPSDPLRGPNYELFLPAQPHFTSSDKLTVYFGILDATLDPASQRARSQLTFAILKDGKPAMALPAEQAEGAPRQNRLVVVRQFDLSRLPLGQYTLEVSAEDPVTHKLAHQTAGFVIG
jgi:VWFA-related protein